MKMGPLGRTLFNSRLRARVQRCQILPVFAQLGGSLTGCRVLELGGGCGIGAELILDRLGAASVDVIDLDPVMTRLAAKRLEDRASIIQADMTALPIPSSVFDAVIAIGAIHLADNWRQALAEVTRVLRPGGRFYFEQPLNPAPTWTIKRPNGGRFPGGFGHTELLDALHTAGLHLNATTRRGLGHLDLLGTAHKTDTTPHTRPDH